MNRGWLVALCAAVLAAPAAAESAGTKIEAAVERFVAAEKVPALAIVVSRGGERIYAGGIGATSDTVFPIASISKQITAALILRLADEGRLSLDAPAGDYLPEFFADEQKLTVRHLLAQTSGLAEFLRLDGYAPIAADPKRSMGELLVLVDKAPRRFAPGSRWSYSNSNYKALALIAERVGGQPFDALVRGKLLGPLGVDGIDSCHTLPPKRVAPGYAADGSLKGLDPNPAAYTGDGGLCASAVALDAWIAAVARSGLLERLAVERPVAAGYTPPYGFGLSTRPLLGRAALSHGGNHDGHTAMLAYLPDERLTVAIVTNLGQLWLPELLEPVLAAALGIDPPKPKPVQAKLDDVLGSYEDGLFRYGLTEKDGQLMVGVDLLGPPRRFVATSDGRFVSANEPASLSLRIVGKGASRRLIFDWLTFRSFAEPVR